MCTTFEYTLWKYKWKLEDKESSSEKGGDTWGLYIQQFQIIGFMFYHCF